MEKGYEERKEICIVTRYICILSYYYRTVKKLN
jgi:hypothetical protein